MEQQSKSIKEIARIIDRELNIQALNDRDHDIRAVFLWAKDKIMEAENGK